MFTAPESTQISGFSLVPLFSYLKAIWHIKEQGGEVKISTIAKMLNVRQPSVVQILQNIL
ncbi:MAG: hypothetical protein P8X83_08360 [Nitrosopumilaceae archaeon]